MTRNTAGITNGHLVRAADRDAGALPSAIAIYARISDDPDRRALGVDRQIADCRRLAAARNWPVAEIYTDNDVSAWSGKPRPEWIRLLGDLRSGRRDGLIAYDLDRITRRPRDLEDLLDICEQRRTRHLITAQGDLDLTTHSGQFMARVLVAHAKKSSDDTSRRVRRKAQELAGAGAYHGGSRPYGFELDGVTHRPAEVAILREAKDRVLAGEPLRSICVDLNARGVTTATGRQWVSTILRRELTTGRIAGKREYHGDVVAQAVWAPIVSEAEWLRLRAILLDPARRMNGGPQRYLLTGLLYCGLCGAKLVARPRADKRRCYICATGPGFTGCGKIRIIADTLEEFITEAVLYRLDTPALLTAMRYADGAKRDSVTSIAAAIADDDAQLKELATAWARRSIGMPEYLTARRVIEERRSALQARLSRQDQHRTVREIAGHAGELQGRWPDLNRDQQRAVIAAILDRAVVHAVAVRGRNRFDPERVEPAWKV